MQLNSLGAASLKFSLNDQHYVNAELNKKYRFVEIIIRRMRFGELFNEDFWSISAVWQKLRLMRIGRSRFG